MPAGAASDRALFLSWRAERPTVTVPTLARIIPILREALCDDKGYDTEALIEMVCERFGLGDGAKKQMMSREITYPAPVAIWVATATLHRKRKSDGPFAGRDILKMVRRQGICSAGIYSVQDVMSTPCVANSKAETAKWAKHRFLFRVKTGWFRLYREGDELVSCRKDALTAPNRQDLPVEYAGLLDWYADSYCNGG